MPAKIRELTLEPSTYKEAVDAVATVMKEPHVKFGSYAKRLAELVKQVVQPSKGMWQPWWTIATRVFGFAYRGHSLDVVKSVATALAEEMGIDAGKAEDLAEKIYNNMARIIGEKAKGSGEETLF